MTAEAAAELRDISQMTVSRVWAKRGIKPRRLERYLSSHDADFEAGPHAVIRSHGIHTPACLGHPVEAAVELFPDAQWQRWVVHFYRNVLSHVPKGKIGDVARRLKDS